MLSSISFETNYILFLEVCVQKSGFDVNYKYFYKRDTLRMKIEIVPLESILSTKI